MRKVAIRLTDVDFSYQSFIRTSFREIIFKTLSRQEVEFSKGYFQALKKISFVINQGDNVGIIGSNGSGKSTLLRLIAGIYAPDSGEVEVNCNTISLLALGTGFNDELSGRENIYLSGLLLGLSKKEVEEKQEAIIAFSDLGEFIDKPIRTYSSGMVSRLAFSISSTIEPDILLIDEILGVGDEQFKRKSQKRIKELIAEEHRTIVLVSHSLDSIIENCNQVIWLEKGQVREIGEPAPVVDAYRKYVFKK